MSNEYYESLTNNLKYIFSKYNFEPKNYFEANNFLRNVFKLDKMQGFSVWTKKAINYNGKLTKCFLIRRIQPLAICIPEVWKAMDYEQKLRVVPMLYDYFCNQMVGNNKDKAPLDYVEEMSISKNTCGYYNPRYKHIVILAEYVFSCDSGLDLCETIVHELTHLQQKIHKKNLSEWLKRNDYDFSKLSSYEKHCYFKGTNHCSSLSFWFYPGLKNQKFVEKILRTTDMTPTNMSIWKQLVETNDKIWNLLQRVPYVCNDTEIAAENKGNKIIIQLYNNYVRRKNQGNLIIETRKSQTINELKENGFELDEQAIKNLENLEYYINLCGSNEKVCINVINYLIEIYKSKKVDHPFIENYEEVEKQYFETLRKKLLEKKNKTIIKDEGKSYE